MKGKRVCPCRWVQCVPSEQTVFSGLLQVAELHCKSSQSRCAASRWNFWDFYSSLFSPRFYFVLVTNWFDFFLFRPSSSPHLHCGSISSSFFFPWLLCFITGWDFVLNLLFGSIWNHSWSMSVDDYKPSLQSRKPPPFDLPQLSPHWLVDKSVKCNFDY